MENPKIKKSLADLAIGTCHAVYRNTEVEDLHAQSPTMDDTLYNKVYQIVSQKVALLLAQKDALIALCTDGLPMPPLPTEKKPSAEDYLLWELIGGGSLFGSDWSKPIDIDAVPGDDLTAYLLGGKFKEYCDGQHKFDDSVMADINIDITNRAYRMLKEILPKDVLDNLPVSSCA